MHFFETVFLFYKSVNEYEHNEVKYDTAMYEQKKKINKMSPHHTLN